MNVEAGATRHAWTIVVYLTAVTMYGVCQTFLAIASPYHRLLTSAIDQNPRGMETSCFKSVGPIAPDLPRADDSRTYYTFLGLCESVR